MTTHATNVSTYNSITISPEQVANAMNDLINENAELRRQIAAGSTSSGSRRTNKPKLSKRDVGMMRDLKRLGSTNVELANAFEVHPATVSRIIRGHYHKGA